MRAIRVHEFGDPEVLRLEELPEPRPVDDEVLVRVQAAGVNPVETYVRAGAYAQAAGAALHARRRRRRRALEAGARVYVSGSLSGTYAEYALCRRDQVHALPDDLSYRPGSRPRRALRDRLPRPVSARPAPSPARPYSYTAPAAAWVSRPSSSRWPPA